MLKEMIVELFYDIWIKIKPYLFKRKKEDFFKIWKKSCFFCLDVKN